MNIAEGALKLPSEKERCRNLSLSESRIRQLPERLSLMNYVTPNDERV